MCEADLDVLTSLLDKSLVRKSGERVWMLETIREFASEQLSASPAADDLRDRHASYYLALAESSDSELRGPGQAEALRRFASEREDLRVAFERLLERDPPAALRLVAALPFWLMSGHFRDGRELLAAALERAPTEPTEARASALVGAALLASEQGEMGSREDCWRVVSPMRAPPARLAWRRPRSACSRSPTRSAGTNRSASARRRLPTPARPEIAGSSDS